MKPNWIVAASNAIGDWVLAIWHWLSNMYLNPRFGKIASEFFLEASVLIAVFPILDLWIQKSQLTFRWAAGSEGVAVALLACAGILASIGHGEE